MIVVHTLPPQTSLIPVATGKAQNGNPFEITLSAYAVGQEDAEQGSPFAPEMLFIRASDQYEYALGFLSAQPFCGAALDMAFALRPTKPMPEPDFDPDEIDHPWQAMDWNRQDADYTDLPF